MILFRYLSREIFITLSAVTIGLLAIVMSGRFVKYLSQAAAGDIAPQILAAVMLYRIPNFLEMILPLAFFISVMLVYGRLYVESEMVVMSACGISNTKLAVYTLIPGICVALCVAALSLYVSPLGISKVQQMLKDPKLAQGVNTLVAGRFQEDRSSGRVTYIEQLNSDRTKMMGVFASQPAQANQPPEIFVAKTAEVMKDVENNQRILAFSEGYRYKGRPGEMAMEITQFERYSQVIRIPDSIREVHQEIDGQSSKQLFQQADAESLAALQWRISLALIPAVMAILALSLSRTTSRKGRYVKLLPGFLLYALYLVALGAVRNALEKGSMPMLPGVLPVHVLFFCIALLFLYWDQLARRFRKMEAVSHG